MTTEKESLKSLSYAHCFNRHFRINDGEYDRLELILKHGIVSPKCAAEHNIPYENRKLKNFTINIPNYDDFVFLFSIEERRGQHTLGDTILFYDNSLKVNTPQELKLPSLSLGEVYARGSISPKLIRGIQVAPNENIENLKQLFLKYVPDLKKLDIIKV